MFAENESSVDFQFSNGQFEFSLISNFSSVQSYFNFRQSILNQSSVLIVIFEQFQSILNLTPISSAVLFQFQSVRVFQKDCSKVYSYKQIDRSGVSQKLCKTVVRRN